MAKNDMRIATKNLKELQPLLRDGESALSVSDLNDIFFEGVDMFRMAALANVRRLFKQKTGKLEKSINSKRGDRDDEAPAFPPTV